MCNTVPKYSSNISNFDCTYIEEIFFSVNFDSFYNESVYGKSCRISNEADHDIKRASRSSGLTSGFLSSVTWQNIIWKMTFVLLSTISLQFKYTRYCTEQPKREVLSFFNINLQKCYTVDENIKAIHSFFNSNMIIKIVCSIVLGLILYEILIKICGIIIFINT